MKIEDAVPDRKVVYTPFKNCDPRLLEDGVITSVNSRFVFVRYGSDTHAKSTDPKDIEYIYNPTI
jgi:hypothetical protein